MLGLDIPRRAGSSTTPNYLSTDPPLLSHRNGATVQDGAVDTARNRTHHHHHHHGFHSASRLAPTVDFGPQINFTIWLLTALSAAFLALRVYCKFVRHRGLWWDDHLLIASWLALVINCAFISASISLGFGRPLRDFNSKNLDIFLLFSNLSGTFSILAALWSKTSFALTVLRISPGWIKTSVWFIMVTVNASLGVAIAITWGQCTPIEKIWRPHLHGSCWPKIIQIRYNMFTAIYSGAMDIVLAVLPWKIIWTLTMNRKEKMGVLVAMSMGVFAGITSIIKITQLPSISKSSFTESTTQLVILGAAESAITIIAASIPILRALLRGAHPPPPPDPPDFYRPADLSSSGPYTGTAHSRGTGRSSTSGGSRLSRLSGLSVFGWGSRGSAAWRSGGHGSLGRRAASLDLEELAPWQPPRGKIVQTEEVVVEYEPSHKGIQLDRQGPGRLGT